MFELRITHRIELPGETELTAFIRGLMQAAAIIASAAAARAPAPETIDDEPDAPSVADVSAKLDEMGIETDGASAPIAPPAPAAPTATVVEMPKRKRRTRAEMAALRAAEAAGVKAAEEGKPLPAGPADAFVPTAPVAPAPAPVNVPSAVADFGAEPAPAAKTVAVQPGLPLGATPPTRDELRGVFMELLRKPDGAAKALGILGEYKVTRFEDIKPADFAAAQMKLLAGLRS
jgi:hypothetical protein